MAAIDAEMAWFKAKAAERGIDLAATGAPCRHAARQQRTQPAHCTRNSSPRQQPDCAPLAAPLAFFCRQPILPAQFSLPLLSHTLLRPQTTTAMQPACEEYTAFLAELRSAATPYAVKAAAFWAMEAVYNEAWARVGEGLKDEAYREFVDRWGGVVAVCGAVLWCVVACSCV